ncbi:conserved hypothetical protein [methanotrophic endosymbiont of Bathymodiolus azoricus (Menez Gwen)]|nr:conserved hypothetical protein [methanotrophic endosymbiont of Bathymodiolus azoricus (Menez Gwen)]
MTLKNIFLILVIQFLTLSIAHSNEKNSFFDGTMLKIPIVDTPEHSGLYQNVEFKPLADGKWEIVGYNKREKSYEIKTVNLFLTEELPIQGFLKVTGLPKDCRRYTRLIRTQLVGDTFEVFIDSKEHYPEGTFCYKRIGLIEFTEIIPLPLYGIKSGDYKYTVNGEYQGVFNVSSDNVVEMPQSDEDDIFDPREGWDEDLR